MSPPIINQLCGKYYDEPIDLILETLLNSVDVDYKQSSDISPEYLEFEEVQGLDGKFIDEVFVEPVGETPCFGKDRPANQVDITRLNPEGKAVYEKFVNTYGKPPTELEFRVMFGR